MAAYVQHEGVIPICARAKNWLPQQRSISDREQRVELITITHMSTYPENWVKTRLVSTF